MRLARDSSAAATDNDSSDSFIMLKENQYQLFLQGRTLLNGNEIIGKGIRASLRYVQNDSFISCDDPVIALDHNERESVDITGVSRKFWEEFDGTLVLTLTPRVALALSRHCEEVVNEVPKSWVDNVNAKIAVRAIRFRIASMESLLT